MSQEIPKRVLVLAGAMLFLLAALGADETERAILSAEDALAAGDLTAAAQQIEASLKEHPGEGGLINLRGIVHARRGELEAARSDFAEAVKQRPALTPAWQNLARACQLQSEQDHSAQGCAAEAWGRVLKLKPGDSEAHTSLALLWERAGRYDESLRHVAALPAKDGQQTAALVIRCADLAGLGHIAEAQTIAAELAARPEFEESHFDSVEPAWQDARTAPLVVRLVEALDVRGAAGPASLERLAIAYEHEKRPADARRILERVAGLDPRNPAHLLELAKVAEGSDDHEGALGYLAHARDLDPENAQTHFLFATISMELNLPLEARASLTRALALQPENPAYNYAMGFVILNTRDAATAATYFQKAVAAKPEEVSGHYALGIADFASGDYEKAKREMQRAQANPKTAGGAEYFLGRMARLEDDAEGATSHLRKSIQLMPDFAESHTEMARVFLAKGDVESARKELERALAIDPHSFQANEQLVVLYKRTHDPRADQQAEHLKALDEERSRRAELMLRTIEVRP